MTRCGGWSDPVASLLAGRTTSRRSAPRSMPSCGGSTPISWDRMIAGDHALAEYALAGMDNQLFVSKYQLHLPEREQLQRELERTLKEGS